MPRLCGILPHVCGVGCMIGGEPLGKSGRKGPQKTAALRQSAGGQKARPLHRTPPWHDPPKSGDPVPAVTTPAKLGRGDGFSKESSLFRGSIPTDASLAVLDTTCVPGPEGRRPSKWHELCKVRKHEPAELGHTEFTGQKERSSGRSLSSVERNVLVARRFACSRLVPIPCSPSEELVDPRLFGPR